MALLNLHQLIFLGKLLKNKSKVGISKVAVLQPAVLLPFFLHQFIFKNFH